MDLADFVNDMEKTEVIVQFNGDLKVLEEMLEAEAEDLGEGFAVITLPKFQVSLLFNFNEIEYIELPKRLALTLERSKAASCFFEDDYNGTLTGKGVIIGIIDSGIDYTHPDFRDNNGSRILYIWDQTENGKPPFGFKYGTEYNNNQINEALKNDNPFEIVRTRDITNGHGTAVAGIAAGNGNARGGREKGIAPEASLIIVKLGYRGFESFARTTEIMRALKYITDKAQELKMPCVINISYGTNDGSHDGSSLFEQYTNAIARRWKTVIVAATGNEGSSGHHFSKQLEPYQISEAGFIVAESVKSFYLTLWKSFMDDFMVTLILPNGYPVAISGSKRVNYEDISGISVSAYYGQPTHYSESQEIYFSIKSNTSPIPYGYWRLLIESRNIIDGHIDIWLPTTEETGMGIAFTNPSPETSLTLPSTVQNCISVGAYNSGNNTAAWFSGRGFARNNAYIKPDLLAPGVNILTTRPGGGYDTFSGTSMAAPFVTGAAALLMEWGIVSGNDLFMYGQRVKAFLKKGAKRERIIKYPNPLWGLGTLCFKNTMDILSGLI